MSFHHPALARLSWHQLRTSRKFLIALLVSAIPLLAGILLVVTELMAASSARSYNAVHDFTPGFTGPVAFLVLGGTVPVVALLLAGGVVADEVEDRTLGYLLVRPLRRGSLLRSKLWPIALVAATLGALQVLLFGLLRFLAMALVGPGQATTYWDGTRERAIHDAVLLGAQIPAGMLAAALAAAAFTCLFVFVSLLTTRHHFLANLLVYAFIEVPFGNLGGRGFGVLTITYHARSLLSGLDPARDELVRTAAAWPVALVALLGFVVAWTWASSWRATRRDFNITSAAS